MAYTCALLAALHLLSVGSAACRDYRGALEDSARHIVVFRSGPLGAAGTGASAFESHRMWLQSLEDKDARSVRYFESPSLKGYSGSFSPQVLASIKSDPRIELVEKNQLYVVKSASAFEETTVIEEGVVREKTWDVWADDGGSVHAKHNILKGRRHFRARLPRIVRRDDRPSQKTVEMGRRVSEWLQDLLRLVGLKKSVQKACKVGIAVQKRAPWGLSRISQGAHIQRLDRYAYPLSAGKGVSVYVLDTGVDIGHPEFEGRAVWGKTVFEGGSDVDMNGHGTHCAGVIAGKNTGMAKKARIVAVKVLGPGGIGSTEMAIGGIEYVIKDHMRRGAEEERARTVVNMSLGGIKSHALNMFVNEAIGMDIHFSVAAGNDGADACEYSPASIEKVITVGALSILDTPAPFSNVGTCIDVYAPGVDIASSHLNGGYRSMSGTSMASPHVAGMIALHLGSKYYTPFELKRQILQDSVELEDGVSLVSTENLVWASASSS